jgi:hypothetical protein
VDKKQAVFLWDLIAFNDAPYFHIGQVKRTPALLESNRNRNNLTLVKTVCTIGLLFISSLIGFYQPYALKNSSINRFLLDSDRPL